MRLLAVVLAVGWLILLSVATQVASVSPHARVQALGNSTHGCISPIPTPIPGKLSPALPGAIRLNEILTVPASPWNCSSNNVTPLDNVWIELYNLSNQPINLYSGSNYLDYGPGTPIYHFLLGSSIPAHGYFVFFPLISSPVVIQQVRLFINSTLVDTVPVPQLAKDTSYARIQDGTGSWQITDQPTIQASNVTHLPPADPGKNKKLKPKPRARHTARKKTRSNSNAGKSNGSTSRGNSGATLNFQIPWSQIHLPEATATGTATATVPPGSPPGPGALTPQADQSTIFRKSLLTLLFIAIAGVLYWCCKLYLSSL